MKKEFKSPVKFIDCTKDESSKELVINDTYDILDELLCELFALRDELKYMREDMAKLKVATGVR